VKTHEQKLPHLPKNWKIYNTQLKQKASLQMMLNEKSEMEGMMMG